MCWHTAQRIRANDGEVRIVMTIVVLAPSYDGFGHSANQHLPDFYIDDNGKRPPSASKDPRWKSFNEITCGSNGSKYVEAKAWYFKPGILEAGSSAIHTPGDELSYADQMIYEVELFGMVSTNLNNAEGWLRPQLSGLSAHTTPSHGRTAHGGEGRINLIIPELDYHVPGFMYYRCFEKTAQKHEYVMDNNVSIYIDVRVKSEKKRKKGDLSISPTSTYGSVSFGYEQSHESSYVTLATESFGIEAKVGNKWWKNYPGIKLQEKTAKAYGTIHKQGGGTIDINAEYPRAPDTYCPGSIGPKVKVPHLHSD